MRAGRQTAGRGRQGRAWSSPVGNLSISTLVRLRPSDPPAPTLALVAAVALHEALAVFAGAVPLLIKWPNDLLAGEGKLAGILLERHGDAVVIGFGANLAFHPDLPDRATTDLVAMGVAVPDPAAVADALADAFARWLTRWRGEGLTAVVASWCTRAHPPGTALTARLPDGERVDGLFAGLGTGGELRLRLADGTARAIHAGDVFLLDGSDAARG